MSTFCYTSQYLYVATCLSGLGNICSYVSNVPFLSIGSRLRNSYSFTQGTEEIPLFVRWRPDQSHTAQLTDINFLS